MGESTTIAHALLTIAAITIASVFAFVMLTKISSLNSSIGQFIYSNVNTVQSDLSIIDFFYNSSGNCFVIYVKNVGSTSISLSNLNLTDVYLGTYNSASLLFTYDPAGSPGHWNYTTAFSSNLTWPPGGTIIVFLYNQTAVQPPYYLKMVLPSGVGAEMVKPG